MQTLVIIFWLVVALAVAGHFLASPANFRRGFRDLWRSLLHAQDLLVPVSKAPPSYGIGVVTGMLTVAAAVITLVWFAILTIRWAG